MAEVTETLNKIGYRDIYEYYKPKGLDASNSMTNRSVLIENFKQIFPKVYSSGQDTPSFENQLSSLLYDDIIQKFSIDKFQALISHAEARQENIA